MKIEEVLNKARNNLIKNNIEDSGVISRVLLQHVLKCDRNELIIRQEEEISENVQKEYENYIQKIIEGIPLQYITNTQEFYGLNFYVDNRVLIPQPDTEILVEEALKIIKNEEKNKVLDICTGSGCIGISIAKSIENSLVTLSDISKDALQVAEKNARSNNVFGRIEIIESNMFDNINDTYDIIVSNPPYIKNGIIKTLSKSVQNEPHLALDGGEDGLTFYRILLNESFKYLKDNGVLCMEIGYDQKEEVFKLAKEAKKYSKIEVVKDLSGNDRVIICRKGE